MCGLVGYLDLRGEGRVERSDIGRMADRLVHRGPDSSGFFVEDDVALGFRRLAIIDLAGGNQPIYNEDRSVVLICNGEIFNYRALRRELEQKDHTFRTDCDVEVLAHLYEEHGTGFLNKLNGQFAFAIYDRRRRRLFLARDHFGINPLYYTVARGVFIFASEIKAILEHPLVERAVDLTGLDQVLSFPGLVSPRTMFENISSLPGGHSIKINNGDVSMAQYWDLDYPREGEVADEKPEDYYVSALRDIFARSVERRLQADVPVGSYLSGGLDSSMIAAAIGRASNGERYTFSINFNDREISESSYQRLVARQLETRHHEILFDWQELAERLPAMVYHCECPVKETYNTCSMALSEEARRAGVKAILAGEGADELCAGYIGYRFDQFGLRGSAGYDLETILEEELRERLWGDKNLFYEIDQYAFRATKTALYSPAANELFEEFDCLNFGLVDKERLRGRHFIHQRSYLDVKLRLSDHLLSEHGDRMALANSVEARYPFLDIELVEFLTRLPPGLKLNAFSEKYILKRAADGLVPREIIEREKFGFRAPGSPYLLRRNVEWINDLLSFERIKREGYFNPEVVERLKAQYTRDGFALHPHLESDLLLIVLSFGILLETFKLPSLS